MQRVKPARAAALLKKNRSTIKRYLDNHQGLLGEDGLVDFETLQQHMGDNPSVIDRAALDETPKSAKPAPGGRRESKHRLDEIRAWEAERDWALSTGQLVDPAKLFDAVTVAAMALRDKMMAPDFVLCERIAEERDPRAIQTLLRETNRGLVEEAIASLRKIVAPQQSGDAAA